MDRAALRAYLRRLLADANSDRFNDVDLNAWLDEAYLDVSRDIKPQSKYVSNTLTAGANTITLPTDFMAVGKGGLSIKDLTDDAAPRELTRREIVDMGRIYPGWQSGDVDEDRPTDYLIRDDAAAGLIAVVVPTPLHNCTFWLEYAPRPTAFTGDTDKPWGDRWPEHHKTIAHGAEVFARQQEGDNEALTLAMQKYQQQLGRFRASVETVDQGAEPVLKGGGYDSHRTYRRWG